MSVTVVGGVDNINIRYGQMSLALIAQAALYQLRQRLGDPYLHYQADQFAEELLTGLDLIYGPLPDHPQQPEGMP